MIAKNVGIRRARGRFVLCTNVDLLFSDKMVRFLAFGRLDERCMGTPSEGSKIVYVGGGRYGLE